MGMFFDAMARRGLRMVARGNKTPKQAAFANNPDRYPETKLGLALGGGAARGWAHIGVMQVLHEAAIRPSIIAGTSIGALVGGCYAAGKLGELEHFARSLTGRRVLGLMDLHFGGSGLISGNRLKRLLERDLKQTAIEELDKAFIAVATELRSGHEIWLTHGNLVDAICASYALPGVFDPVKLNGRWLMDGALVNPIPITAARAQGASIVIAVNLNGDGQGRGTIIPSHGGKIEPDAKREQEIQTPPKETEPRPGVLTHVYNAAARVNPFARRAIDGPGMASVMIDAFNITQDRIARSRLAGDPPDLMIAPKLSGIGLFDFQKAEDAIACGREAAQRALPDIRAMLNEQPAAAAAG